MPIPILTLADTDNLHTSPQILRNLALPHGRLNSQVRSNPPPIRTPDSIHKPTLHCNRRAGDCVDMLVLRPVQRAGLLDAREDTPEALLHH
jgi:hypothetical protein